MKPLSRKAMRIRESVIREMTRMCQGKRGINLAQGSPDVDFPSGIEEVAVEAIKKGWNQYSVTYGERDLRQAIAKKAQWYNSIGYDPETEITVTCGATEAMSATLQALMNPGDEVIIFEPFYENYGPTSVLSGASTRCVTLRPPNWHYDSTELRHSFRNKTKAIIINTPHNPTGKVFSADELTEIAALCMQWDCVAIADEIYEHIIFDNEKHISIASLDGMAERTVTINSLSKTYSVTGWRVGWAMATAEISENIRKVHDFLTVGAPTPFQKAGVHALNRMEENYYREIAGHYVRMRNELLKTLSESGFEVTSPKGAYYIMAGADTLMDRFGIRDDHSFALMLMDVTGIASVPGSSFYETQGLGKTELRFCFAKRRDTLAEVRARLKDLD